MLRIQQSTHESNENFESRLKIVPDYLRRFVQFICMCWCICFVRKFSKTLNYCVPFLEFGSVYRFLKEVFAQLPIFINVKALIFFSKSFEIRRSNVAKEIKFSLHFVFCGFNWHVEHAHYIFALIDYTYKIRNVHKVSIEFIRSPNKVLLTQSITQ